MADTNPVHDDGPSGRGPRESTMEDTITPPPRFATRVGERPAGRGWVWPFTVTLHALGAAAVVIVPLLGNEPLPAENDHVANAFFVSPQFVAPPPPPPPPPAAARAATAPKAAPTPSSAAFAAPIEVPKDLPGDSLDLGVEGGPPPPAPVLRVGGVIREPKKVKDVAPAYPNIAKTAKIQGVVILEA